MKNTVAVFVVLLFSHLFAVSNAQETKPGGLPNIVFIVSDDQGGDDYSFRQHPHIQTPSLDKLASQSLTFTRGYVPASLCCPSLATIITGLYPHQNKINANDPPPSPVPMKGPRGASPEMAERWNALLDKTPTLPRWLAAQGYLSFQTGKWWHGDFSRGGFTHGMTKGSRHGDEGLTIGRQGLKPVYDFVATAREQKKPFFLWYAPMLPHSPHTPPERLLQKYKDKTPSLHVARYWAMCEWFDETCGDLLGYLDREGLAENTIVVYITDNGWIQSPNSPNFAPKNKTSPYDRGHRTPIMIRWPGQIKLEKSASLASSIDLVPTILTALKLPKSAEMTGINLLDAKAVQARQYVFGECFTHNSQSLDDPAAGLLWRWVTDGRWRLIVPRTCQADPALQTIPKDSRLTPDLQATLTHAKPMLFDLHADPDENHDLADQQPELAAKLRKQLDDLWTPKLVKP